MRSGPSSRPRAGGARPLTGDDPEPAVHQVHEIPVVKPHVTEYRCHRLRCPHGGTTTVSLVPAGATTGYGPRAQAVAALLTGSCRLGKRGVSQLFGDLFGLPLSPAMVCKLQHRSAQALAPVADAALVYTRGQPANVDEAGWTQGRQRAWLWAAVTTLVVAFLIRRTCGRAALDDLRAGSTQVHTTDRYPVYTHLRPHKRQVCWAHLRRDFQAMIDRGGSGQAIGAALLACSDALFENWYRVRDGTLARSTCRSTYIPALRRQVGEHLRSGAACGCAETAATCAELLAVEASRWTFARVAGVEPTNNAAEREVRHAVCWRKTSTRHRQRTPEPVRRAGPHGHRLVSPAEPPCPGVPHRRRDRAPHRTGATPPTLIPAEAQQTPMRNSLLANC
ncbi:Transposase IS66 family protein [Gemmata obscuriglobus]|nr:Transposase IS66 family protein [Gemmata obscuriglobus]VTS09000.1 Transposase IS66 family OS=Singulisphaera acidiphila (strain ATCC BAA-1392 / DSM 18658 / VKM B-2454 / MOB10) GN=Sinac_6249 PE=4 SV=1: zf-IS66: DDE_Tnp_IS66 [Gemmata obscuriglobus UQM 2246]